MSATTITAFLAIGVVVLLLAVYFLVRPGGSGERQKSAKRKDRNSLIREANKKLQQNPRDAEALRTLADLYYDESNWEKALTAYATLIEQSSTNSDIDQYEVNLRHGVAAIQLKRYEEAYKSLAVARTFQSDVFEINFNLGFLELRRKNPERAVSMLQAASEEKPDHIPAQRYLGQALYRVKKFKDAIAVLRRVVDGQPDDKESLYVLGHAYYEIGKLEQAVRIFSHLRADPTYGPRSALMSGSIHHKNRHYERAAYDYELGLKHENIPDEVKLELKYRLASAYTKSQDVQKAVALLEELHQIRPDYKDVAQQLAKNRELNNNRNLQIYLISPASEFVTLCRKVTSRIIPQARIKITDISVNKNEYADILAEVETSQWLDVILFRFVRTSGQVGELMLRDLHGRIKELKAGRGFCVAAGTFTEGAEQFVEARLIDLIAKDRLMDLLSRVE